MIVCAAAPLATTGIVPVSLFAGAEASLSSLTFEYTVPFVLRELSPSHGSSLGNTELVVEGSGFVDSEALSCIFTLPGSRNAKVSVSEYFVSDTEVTCATPSLARPISVG